MYRLSFKRTIPILFAVFGGLFLGIYSPAPLPLMMPWPDVGFSGGMEINATMFAALICSSILRDNYEIELSLVCGVKTERLFFSKLVPVAVYTLIPMYVFLCSYELVGYSYSLIGNQLSFYAPEKYKLYLAVSMAVTMLFFFGLFSLVRVVSRSSSASILGCVFIYFTFYEQNKSIRQGKYELGRAIFDPFISTYIISDEPVQVFDLGICANIWSYNRLIFTALGILLTVLTYFLLKRERLHCGFAD